MLESSPDLLTRLLDAEEIIKYGGTSLLLLVIFMESGVIFGFWLPGDYLLFCAGLFCGSNVLNINLISLLFMVITVAVSGSIVGYFTGRGLGIFAFKDDNSLFFKKRYMDKVSNFYLHKGKSALVIGRFLPMIRTFVPIMAGATLMPFSVYMKYNIIGAILWTCVLIPLGYILGEFFPQIINYIQYIIIGFVILTSIPLIRSFLKIQSN